MRGWAALATAAALLGAVVVAGAWRPEWAAQFVSWLLADRVLFHVRTRSDMFALTIDDGPHVDTTPRLLEVLRKHDAQATFFVLGESVRSHPDLVAQICRDGHELGNHMMRDEPSLLLDARAFARDLSEAQSILSLYGEPRWFRPGSGWFTTRMLRTAARQGLKCALGTVVGLRASGAGDALSAARLAKMTRPGTIVVLHEGQTPRTGVSTTVDDLLNRLAQKGLRAVTLTDLVASRRPLKARSGRWLRESYSPSREVQ